MATKKGFGTTAYKSLLALPPVKLLVCEPDCDPGVEEVEDEDGGEGEGGGGHGDDQPLEPQQGVTQLPLHRGQGHHHRHPAAQYSAVQYSTVQYITLQCRATTITILIFSRPLDLFANLFTMSMSC